MTVAEEIAETLRANEIVQVVKASELVERVFTPLATIRYGHLRENYEKEFAAYEKLLAKVSKAGGGEVEQEDDRYVLFQSKRPRGIYTLEDGKPRFVRRPEEPSAPIFEYRRRWKDSDGLVHSAGGRGVIANPLLNRDIRIERVERYETAMAEGQWISLYSDPIAITTEGHIINGQHRLAAAFFVTNLGKWPNDPEFLVVFGVDPKEALYADGSHRTAVDEKTIASKLLSAVTA